MTKPVSLEKRAAADHPELVEIAERFFDAVEEKKYSEAYPLYNSVFADLVPTDYDGIMLLNPKSPEDVVNARLVLGYVLMARR